MEIPEKMSCADFCNNDGWALTVTGKTLYKLDENGACLEKIEMETNQKFIRLIATYRFVFLLPQKGNTILVYDAYLHQFNLINSGIEEISHLLPEKLYFSSYWEYIIEKNKIKVEKKKEKQGIYANQIANAARLSTRNITPVSTSEKEEKIQKWEECAQNARKGSLLEKANMVRDFNERNNRQ